MDQVEPKMETESKTEIRNDNNKKCICDKCGLSFFSKSGIRRHIEHKHLGRQTSSGAQLKTEICSICGVYTTKRNLKDHVDSHSAAKNFKCDHCEMSVKSIFTLRKHVKRVHSNNSRIECIVCGKKSMTASENNFHMKIHSSEREFECESCGLRFARDDGLKNHLIKHKEGRSYSCGLCTKVFKHSSSVSGHRKTHKVNGFYHCGCCSARFPDYGQLKAHIVSEGHSYEEIKME